MSPLHCKNKRTSAMTSYKPSPQTCWIFSNFDNTLSTEQLESWTKTTRHIVQRRVRRIVIRKTERVQDFPKEEERDTGRLPSVSRFDEDSGWFVFSRIAYWWSQDHGIMGSDAMRSDGMDCGPPSMSAFQDLMAARAKSKIHSFKNLMYRYNYC